MGKNMIGIEELEQINKLGYEDARFGRFQFMLPSDCPDIPFSLEEMEKKKNEYLLILGVGHFSDGSSVTIRNMRKVLGMEPNRVEPCFYNQDWYENESFIDVSMENGWFLIRREVYDKSRAVPPAELEKTYAFPSAIRCTYAFFVAWLSLGVKLWYNNFVWCSDIDHNGDRIYVGRYQDIDKKNKNGFNIHRHLALRQCYGCID